MSPKVDILSILVLLLQAYAESDECTLPDGSSGYCILALQCKSTVALLRSGQRPKICGFQGLDSKVCCENPIKPLRKSLKFCYRIPFIMHTVGSVPALPTEFMHMASLGYGSDINNTVWACGGGLISNKFILTAAHCIFSRALGKVNFVRLGDLNLKLFNESSEPQDFRVVRTITHPKYRRPSKYHDIALIELDRDIEVSAHVKPACVYTERKSPNRTFVATGWGNLGFNGAPAAHLQKVYIEQKGIDECKKFYEVNARTLSSGIIDDMHICAGDINRDTCKGDSGGPLQLKNNVHIDAWDIHGIVSFGKACGLTNAPGVYIRVSNYIDWIESIVWPD